MNFFVVTGKDSGDVIGNNTEIRGEVVVSGNVLSRITLAGAD